VARSRLVRPLLGTLLYALILVTILVLPLSRPHVRRGYLREFPQAITRRFIADIGANILLFVPLGWGLHRAARRAGVRSPMVAVGVAGALFSLTMETVQYVLPYRYSSVVDVAANTVGVLLGASGEELSGRRGCTRNGGGGRIRTGA
jgi:glycopeptide antibiotics resistance protein